MKRITSIDFARGMVMIIMALDHVRDLMHIHAITQSPVNLTTTTPVLFFTRLVTHLCAPTFVLLSGVSAYLSLQRSDDKSKARMFLVKRGIYLVILDLTLVNFGIFFDLGFHSIIFEVIATIGFGFIVLGLLSKASARTIGITGLAIIFLHNLVPLIPFSEPSVFKTILMPFFSPQAFPLPGNRAFIIGYPPIPWLGIMLAGFACGKWFERTPAERKKFFLKTGLLAILLFIIIRYINIYGDPAPWTSQKNGLYTFLSFLNVTKYPPSLSFCLATLGVTFLMLALAEKVKGKIIEIISNYGKVPLFYFLVHFYLIHITLLLLLVFQGIKLEQANFASGTYGRPKGIESGVNLGVIYLIWIGIVLILYKPCVWFGKYKATHKNWWLKYI